jgi:hypothetical protein
LAGGVQQLDQLLELDVLKGVGRGVAGMPRDELRRSLAQRLAGDGSGPRTFFSGVFI